MKFVQMISRLIVVMRLSVGGAHSSARSTNKVLEIYLHYSPNSHEDLGRRGLV